MQIARVRVEPCCLPRDRLNNMGVAVADAGHIVIGVEVRISVAVIEPHAFATHEVSRLFVEQPVGRPEQAIAARDQVACRDDIVCGHVRCSSSQAR
jgi:hypothetical protein